MPTQFTNRSNRILQPVRPWFVYMSLFIALLLEYVPFENKELPIPDWIALVLVFWSIREPQNISMGMGFCLGILVDIGQGAPMGQHALAYVMATFFANSLSRRVMWFPALLQALHVLPILFASLVLMAVVQMLNGKAFPGAGYFLSSVVSAALWLPLTYLLLLPQFQPVDRDENRPI